MSAPTIDRLADAVCERLLPRLVEELRALIEHQSQPPAELVDAAELARILGMTRAYVYEHAEELGVLRVREKGTRPRLRFDVERTRAMLAGGTSTVDSEPTRPPARKSRKPPTSAQLLPIRGEQQ